MSPRQLVIIAWSSMDGSEPTGQTVWRDGCHRAVFRTCKRASALCWSSDVADLSRAETYAALRGYTVMVLPDTDDVLDVARARAMDLEPVPC